MKGEPSKQIKLYIFNLIYWYIYIDQTEESSLNIETKLNKNIQK